MKDNQGHKDITFRCNDCGQPWVFTVSEQKFYSSKGLAIPKRCAKCRAERKATINEEGMWRK